MIFKGRLRDRAIAIETEAVVLLEKHANGAYEVADGMERQANDLSATLFWHAVKKLILARSDTVKDVADARAQG